MLPPGEHVLAITTTLDREAATGPVTIPGPGPARHREQFGHHFGSGLTWRSITLEPATAPPPGPVLRVTPLYLHDGRELAELTVPLPARRAQVRLAGRTHAFDLPGRDFGQARVRFPVPEARGPAEVTVDGGDPVTFTLTPARKWTLHLIPHVHLDVGYTDTQGKVLELHSRNLDRAVAALDRDPGFAFSVDGSLVLAQYLATRSDKSAGRVLQALRDGRIAVNAFHSLFLSGVASLEEIYRAAYLAARLRDEHGVPVTYANLTDVPSYSAALPSILAALGIGGFVGIENHHRGGNADSDLQHLLSPVMWEGVDGSRVLTHFSDTYSQLRFMVGDPQTVEGGAHSLCRLLARYERPDYLPHDLAIIGTHADNEDLVDGDAGFAARWNAVYAHPRIVVSTMAGYLDAVRPWPTGCRCGTATAAATGRTASAPAPPWSPSTGGRRARCPPPRGWPPWSRGPNRPTARTGRRWTPPGRARCSAPSTPGPGRTRSPTPRRAGRRPARLEAPPGAHRPAHRRGRGPPGAEPARRAGHHPGPGAARAQPAELDARRGGRVRVHRAASAAR
ncbi:hypothetical protein ACFQQB_62625 [Nonomuraea rubra]|uniref:glycoside hydrolase family 38 N-terminal domain-containing protein n=1 Tax=Nonomuraea rubra TaxID=46180 RepID=UPI00360D42B6